MINRYKNSQFISLLEFCKRKVSKDFFFTKNNIRNYIKDELTLKELLKNSEDIYIEEDKDIQGVILRWKSIGNNVSRFYIKINTETIEIAEKLLTVLLWSYKKDLYIKIHKDSILLPIFKRKGFKFNHFRGQELLLKRKGL